MGFSLELKDSVIVIVLKDNVTLSEIVEVLAVVTKLLDKGKPFAFLVDTRSSNGIPPLSAGFTLVKWMKTNKPKIIKTLLASSIVFKSSKVSALLQWVFQKQRPARPNLVTSDYSKAFEFVRSHK